MTINSGDILRGDLFYDAPASSQAMNVFYWRNFGDAVSDAAALAALDTWATTTWGVPWALIGDQTCEITHMDVKKVLANGTVVVNVGTVIVQKTGDHVTAEAGPAAVSAFLQCDVANSTLKGRKYVPGLSEAAITAGLFNPSALAAMADLLVAWQTTIEPGTAELTPVILSTAVSLFRLLADSGLVSDVPAYQRRRKPQVGI